VARRLLSGKRPSVGNRIPVLDRLLCGASSDYRQGGKTWLGSPLPGGVRARSGESSAGDGAVNVTSTEALAKWRSPFQTLKYKHCYSRKSLGNLPVKKAFEGVRQKRGRALVACTRKFAAISFYILSPENPPENPIYCPRKIPENPRKIESTTAKPRLRGERY